MKDNTDKFIIDHYRSMSYGEMADKLGINKSTVSRRAAMLREAGELEEKPSGADMAQARAMRERLKGCTIDRADRLEALNELRELLHDDLTMAGGQGLARVSSEYRAVLAEIEALSIELDLVENKGKDVSTIDLLVLKSEVQEKYAEENDRDLTGSIVFSVFMKLRELDILGVSVLDLIRAECDMKDGKHPQPARRAK